MEEGRRREVGREVEGGVGRFREAEGGREG